MEPLNAAPGGPQGNSGVVGREGARGVPLSPWMKRRAGAWREGVIFISCLLLICGVAAFTGVVPTIVLGHDNFLWLGNGWRVLCGQRPHVDYYSPWGPVSFLIVGLGLAISNASPNALGYGSAIFGLVMGLWGYGLGRNRLECALRIVFGLYLALLVTAPYALGIWPTWSTHAMLANRYGFALAAMVVLECLQRPEGSEGNAGESWGGISSGAALGLTLFLKASYFGVGVVIVGASLIFRGLSRRRLGGMGIGFGVVTLALLAYLRFDVLKVVQDLRMAAGGRSKDMDALNLASILAAQVASCAVVIALSLYGSSPQRQKRSWLERQQLLIWGLLVFFADAALIFSNMQARGTPLLAAFGIVVASRAMAQRRTAGGTASRTETQRTIIVLLLCGFLSLPQLCSDLAGLGYGAWQKAFPSAAMSRVRFRVARLRPMILYDGPFEKRSNGAVYTARINEGIALLEGHCGPGDRVLNMDMVNPFPYALGWRPPRGGMAAVAYNYLFSDESHPSNEAYFGDTTVVMEPKEPALGRRYYDGYYQIYHPAMLERYRLAAESESWRLYRQK